MLRIRFYLTRLQLNLSVIRQHRTLSFYSFASTHFCSRYALLPRVDCRMSRLRHDALLCFTRRMPLVLILNCNEPIPRTQRAQPQA
jgi:hypothetical protein